MGGLDVTDYLFEETSSTNQDESGAGSTDTENSDQELPSPESTEDDDDESCAADTQDLDRSGPGDGTKTTKIQQLLTEEVREAAGDLQSKADSVRTTVCLSLSARRLFKDLSARTGKTKKRLLGGTLRLCRGAWEEDPKQLRETAAEFRTAPAEETKNRTSMAIAPGVREGLNSLSQESGLSRDQLVEVGIRLTWAALEEQNQRKICPHEDALDNLYALYEEAEKGQLSLAEREKRSGPGTLEYDDPIEDGLAQLIGGLREMIDAIEEEIESGRPMKEGRTFL